MSKGLIICGYPGIGKSSCAGWNGAIDLESSTFSQEMGMMNWIPLYVKTAIQLAEQGFTVFISTHREVRRYLASNPSKIPVVIFCPKVEWKEQWIQRLQARYDQSKDSKDLRALKHVQDFWDKIPEMIKEAREAKIPVIQPAELDYNLKSYIYWLQFHFYDCDFTTPLHMLKNAIEYTNGDDEYSVGMRNGMRYAAYLIDGVDPEYERLSEKRPLSKEELMARAKVLDALRRKKGENHGETLCPNPQSNASSNQPQAETVATAAQASS